MDLSLFVNYLEIFMAFFSISTFIYAVYEGIKARKEYKNALSLSNEYNRLVEEFQGRILDWEELINELATQVMEEKESIWLALDTLSYGSVTVPEVHRRFWSGLISKAALGVPIQIITFNDEAQRQMLRKQFGEDVAREPTEIIQQALQRHLDYVKILQQQGKENVKIFQSSYFPLHLFIFKGRGIAILALQEIVGDGTVRARAIRTHESVMIQICRQSFIEMRDFGETVEKAA